ncbi:neural stem cell-derived dendrite regulator [Nesidiocoris tenuis]|uniref:sn-1-specific diacylglycerol lipase n=1 Tax=Nesidiocoris tenuis TaxID=355587 RepID=A0ABN7B284_9HEMI|nr:neural stem cell-derived dendrite regulator [Nesidiocoris tenuis]
MPALLLFGRKWLAGTDDMVFPAIIELFIRIVWISLIGVATCRYYNLTYECSAGGELVRAYLVGKLAILSLVSILLLVIMNRSAQGAICDVYSRRHVPKLIAIKIILLAPEVVLNVLGSIWTYMSVIKCNYDHFTNTAINVLVCLDWLLFTLAVFTLFMVIDPIGSVKLSGSQPDLTIDSLRHRKVTSVWLRRFRWIFCWIIRDKQSHEAFTQVAGLISSMFRDTDLVPTDLIAGFVLLRVKQKRESREQRRIELVNELRMKYSSDLKDVFYGLPSWMSLEKANHYMMFSLSSYGCPMIMILHCFTGIFKLIANSTCCVCFRSKPTLVRGDNCCLCNLAGVKAISKLSNRDILYASFKNYIFELPFVVITDHKTKTIVIAVRGSMSMRDVFTDLTALPEKIEGQGIPPDSYAHKGMMMCAMTLKKHLEENHVLDKAFGTYPNYGLVLTGHSLGAGTSILLGLLLRPTYPELKVYAFSTPGGLVTRKLAEVTEEFAMTVGLGDDFIMRLSIQGFENLRTQLFNVLQSCRLPKYRVFLNGFGYALFGIPSRDLESVWVNDRPTPRMRPPEQQRKVLIPPHSDVMSRRYTKHQLVVAGKILHIATKRKSKDEKRTDDETTYEMRWLTPEDLLELRIMPRMLLDHFPYNLLKAIATVLEEQRTEIIDYPEITLI